MKSSTVPAACHGKLGREIVVILAFKALALSLIWVLFFSAPPVPHPGPQATASQILGGAVANKQVPRGASHD